MAAPNQPLPPIAELPVPLAILRDAQPFQGPLAGLVASLDAPSLATCDALLLLGCDTPLVQPALLRLLVAELQAEPCDAAVPCVDDQLHPLTSALRPTPARAAALRLFQSGQRRLLDLFRELNSRHIPAERLRAADPDLRSLLNANSPHDYQRIVTLASNAAT